MLNTNCEELEVQIGCLIERVSETERRYSGTQKSHSILTMLKTLQELYIYNLGLS